MQKAVGSGGPRPVPARDGSGIEIAG